MLDRQRLVDVDFLRVSRGFNIDPFSCRLQPELMTSISRCATAILASNVSNTLCNLDRHFVDPSDIDLPMFPSLFSSHHLRTVHVSLSGSPSFEVIPEHGYATLIHNAVGCRVVFLLVSRLPWRQADHSSRYHYVPVVLGIGDTL